MLLFNPSLPGMEMIHYQVNSPLRRDLINLFQEQIDYARQQKYDSQGKLRAKNNAEVKAVRAAITNNWTKFGVPKFKQIVEKNTGFTVKKITDSSKNTSRPTFMYAVDICLGDIGLFPGILQQQRMTGNTQEYFNTDKSKAKLAKVKLADIFNKETSHLDIRNAADKQQATINQIYLDVLTSFMLDYFIGTDEAARERQLTAAELTAIMIHEIGHSMTTVEHFGDQYAKVERLKRWEVAIRNIKTVDEAKEVISQISEALPALKKAAGEANCDDEIVSSRMKQVVGVIESAANALKKVDTEDAGVLTTIGKVFVLLATLLGFMFIASIWVVQFMVTYVQTIYRTGVYLVKYRLNEPLVGGDKTSDKATGANNKFLAERWADEFSTRHGCGPDLITGLNKIYEISKVLGLGSIADFCFANGAKSNSVIWEVAQAVATYKLITFGFYYADPIIYERQNARANRIVENMYGFFKNANVDGAVINEWLAKVKAAEKATNSNRQLFDLPIINNIWKIISCITNPADLYSCLVDGRMGKDIEMLENNIDKIANNQLFMIAADLKYGK